MRKAAPQVLEAALLCSPWPLLGLNYGGKGVLGKTQMRIRPQTVLAQPPCNETIPDQAANLIN